MPTRRAASGGPHLEAPAGAANREGERPEGDQGERDPEMGAAPAEGGQDGGSRELGGLRVVDTLRILPRTEHRVLHEQDRDVVEEQGRDRLARPAPGAEHAGHRRPEAAAEEAEDRHRGQEEPGRPRGKRQRAPRREQRADVELALAAHVDEPDPSGHGDGDRREQERGQLDERLRDPVPAPERAREDVRVGADRVLPEGQQHQRERRQSERGQPERAPESRQPRRPLGRHRRARRFGRAHAGRDAPVIR